MRKVSAVLSLCAIALCLHGEDIASRIVRVKGVTDAVCSVTNAALLKRSADGKSVDPLAMWTAIQDDGGAKCADAFVRVDFILSPESGSDIRCRAELPLPDKWNGRLWGKGNSGYAGALPSLSDLMASGSAAVTTDLGTWKITDFGRNNSKVWPANVQRDFNWRATHLMTVYGKRIVAAFYGKLCDKAYFIGGSTGGRQAMSEAIRFPEDYDGIIAALPDNSASVNEIAVWHLWRQTHDADGRTIFTTNEMRVVSDAAVAYRAKSDPAPYAGRFLADARFPERDVDGFLALAAERCPTLAMGNKIQRLKALYMPLMHGGACYFNGFAPGSYLGKNMQWMGIVNLRSYLMAHGISPAKWKDIGMEDIDGFLMEYAPEFNACSPDLSAFAKRGGKLIMSAGWEDQTIPPAPIIDYYERVCERDGCIGKTKEYFRLFCVPGCAHGGGKGRTITGAPGGERVRKQLIDWCEKGTPPETIDASYDGWRKKMPVAAYPDLCVLDANGRWIQRDMPRGVVQIDGRCLETKCKVER